MREVAVLGVGQIPVREHWELSLRDLAITAGRAAMADAGVNEIDAMYVGNMTSGSINQQRHLGAVVADFMGQSGVEAVKMEAACGSAEFLCEILPNLKSDYPETVFIVATHDDDPTHSAYYESGATLVATCPWKPEPITQLICKHVARQPPKPETPREKIWNALPWQATHTDH